MEQICVPFDEDPWSTACPVIETFRWRPSAYHFQLFSGGEGDPRFRDALPAYDATLFTGWPSLKLFERPNRASDFMSTALCVKFMRRGGGIVIEEIVEGNQNW